MDVVVMTATQHPVLVLEIPKFRIVTAPALEQALQTMHEAASDEAIDWWVAAKTAVVCDVDMAKTRDMIKKGKLGICINRHNTDDKCAHGPGQFFMSNVPTGLCAFCVHPPNPASPNDVYYVIAEVPARIRRNQSSANVLKMIDAHMKKKPVNGEVGEALDFAHCVMSHPTDPALIGFKFHSSG